MLTSYYVFNELIKDERKKEKWNGSTRDMKKIDVVWNDQWSSRGDMNTNGNEKDGDESKEDNGVNQYGDPASPHVAEVHHSAVARQLEQQPWCQHHK